MLERYSACFWSPLLSLSSPLTSMLENHGFIHPRWFHVESGQMAHLSHGHFIKMVVPLKEPSVRAGRRWFCVLTDCPLPLFG